MKKKKKRRRKKMMLRNDRNTTMLRHYRQRQLKIKGKDDNIEEKDEKK